MKNGKQISLAVTLPLLCMQGSAFMMPGAHDTTKVRTDSSTVNEAALQNNNLRQTGTGQQRESAPQPVWNRQVNQNVQDKGMSVWPIERKEAEGTLLFSDSPEYVEQDGILYSDTVTGSARVLFYHLNDTSADKKVAVILENNGDKHAMVKVTRGGMGTPDMNYCELGKATQLDYFRDSLDYSICLASGEKRLLQSRMNEVIVAPQHLTYGVYDFVTDEPVKVTVVMYPAYADPVEFVASAPILPKDEHRLRGTFSGMDMILTSKKVYNPQKDGIVYFTIGSESNHEFLQGVDATDGSLVTNWGNYGVLYHIEIPTVGHADTQYYLSPRGGVYAGAMTVRTTDKGKVKVLSTPQDRVYFGNKDIPAAFDKDGNPKFSMGMELADLGVYNNRCAPLFEYSPPGASNLPVDIILMPSQQTLAPRQKKG